jgi:hypothetical protein
MKATGMTKPKGGKINGKGFEDLRARHPVAL